MFKLLLIGLFTTGLAYGKSFSNEYIQFELPPGWNCVLEGSEYVCQSDNTDRKKEAIIILAAKKRGPQDDLAQYQAYLKKTKTYQLPGAKTQKSEPKSVKTQTINNQQWVDALHLASEVPGFYTRYLATTKADIGVAVTFSVTKSLYNAYKELFDAVIKSMRVFRSQKTNLAGLGVNRKVKDENFDDTTFVPQDDVMDIGVNKVQKRKSSGGGSGGLILIVAVAAAGFILMKLKKGKGKKKQG